MSAAWQTDTGTKVKVRFVQLILLLLSSGAGIDARSQDVRFTDVTEDVGLRSEATWKYGGPTLADLNNDGRYDLVLTNHHAVPAQLFFATNDNRFSESGPLMRGDVHGIAAGDYDRDGLVDLVVSLGGGNGTTPQPPRLLRNTGGGFEDVTDSAGIADLGARGRSVRWIDLDTDGDLDLLEIVAEQLATESGPRNILFENIGDGTFRYRESPAFEAIEAERVLITDIDADGVPDLVTFTPLRIMKGNNDFGFTDVSEQWLAGLSQAQREHAMAVSEADIDNDGDMDLYVARGKTYYEIANNSVELDESGRMNLRDEGNESEDSIEFGAGETVGLTDFWHWPRGVDVTLPVYLGNSGEMLATPTSEVPVSSLQARGFPGTLEQDGWYLGYLGEGRWKLAWKLNGNLAWDIRASVTGVTSLYPEWDPQELGVPDLLLVNEGDRFRDASDLLPAESGDNNWGVVTADFDNDTDADFFVWRFGRLHGRIADVLLTNADGQFTASANHGATNLAGGGHGDMGVPVDYDGDGWLDLLSGSDNYGHWDVFRNQGSRGNSITIRVGNSPAGTDAHNAGVSIMTAGAQQTKFVRSAGAVHSQGLGNLVHFGLGEITESATIRVRWRTGEETTLEKLLANEIHDVGAFVGPRIGRFDPQKDLYLPQFDSKPDVDDIHSVAGVAMLLRDARFANVNYRAVAGAYGEQRGLYVPSPELFELAFGDNWSDAHNSRELALDTVTALVEETVENGGQVWVAEAGQSDFTADWLGRIDQNKRENVHVVQHSDWNEYSATDDKLDFVQAHATYHRIPDGNELDNGTPGFRTSSVHLMEKAASDDATGAIWQLARDVANRFNGVDGRYLNPDIEQGGMDFSDVVESCWIFGCDHLRDADAFFLAFMPSKPE